MPKAMVGFFLPPDVAQQIAVPGGEPASELHVTLAILGEPENVELRRARAAIQRWAAHAPVINAEIQGLGQFSNQRDDGTVPFYASVDAPSLPFVRDSLLQALEWEFDIQLEHGFSPHITLAYVPADAEFTAKLDGKIPVTFERVTLAYGDERYEFDLLGTAYEYNGYPVKAVAGDDGEWILEVLGAPFGGPFNGKDRQNQYFHKGTNFMLDDIPQRPIINFHGFDEDMNPVDVEVVGQELSHEVREDGVWFRVLLDKTKAKAAQLWEAAQQGLARASSGALSHLVRPLGDEAIAAQGGRVDVWPIGELSLVDLRDGVSPINPYAIAYPVAQKAFKAAGLDLPDTLDRQSQDTTPENQPEATGVSDNEELVKMTEKTKDEAVKAQPAGITLDQLEAFLNKRDADKAEAERIARLEAEAEELKALKAQIAEAEAARTDGGREQVKKLQHPAAGGGEEQPQIEVSSKWDGFTVGQLGLAYTILKAVGAPTDGTLFRALHAKALKTDLYANQIKRDGEGNIVREFNPGVNAMAIKAVKSINPMQMAVKADELHGSDVADAGDEWVPAYWSPELWDMVRNESNVIDLFRQVEVPGESLTIPTVEGNGTVYKVAQTDDQAELDLSAAAATMSKATTGNVTLTPVKGKIWLGFTTELTEDSIVPVLTTMQRVTAFTLSEAVEEILISGDTDTTSANNSDTGNGSIAATWRLLIANGLRDYALENSAASDRGALTAEDFTAVMALLGTNGAYALNPDKLKWIFDPGVYRQGLLLGETLTADKAGGVGTFQDGRLQAVFGSDVVVSDQYAKTDSNGQIHNTAGNNTKGSYLLVRPGRWIIGFGRQISIRVPSPGLIEAVTDTQHIVGDFRLDFQTHSGGGGAALGYNITI